MPVQPGKLETGNHMATKTNPIANSDYEILQEESGGSIAALQHRNQETRFLQRYTSSHTSLPSKLAGQVQQQVIPAILNNGVLSGQIDDR